MTCAVLWRNRCKSKTNPSANTTDAGADDMMSGHDCQSTYCAIAHMLNCDCAGNALSDSIG